MKRILALVLTLTMLLSVFAMSATAATRYSSLSVSSADKYADVTIDWNEESLLGQYPAKKLVEAVEDDLYTTFRADTIVWAKYGSDNYTVTAIEDGVIDLRNCSDIYAIIGNGKQLDYANNTKVNITIETQSLFKSAVLTAFDTNDNEILIDHQSFDNYGDYYSFDYAPALPEGAARKAVFQLNDAAPEEIVFYEGYYTSAEQAEARGQVMRGVQEGKTVTLPLHEEDGYIKSYTAVFTVNGEKVAKAFDCYSYCTDRSHIGIWGFYDDIGSEVDYDYDYDYANGTTIYRYYTRTHPENAEYYYRMRVSGGNGISDVEYAYVDNRKEDIKEQLFGGQGYRARYTGKGHLFTIKMTDGEMRKYQISLTAEEKMEEEGDTYFQVKSALDEQDQRVPAYVMPYNADSLYKNSFNCYQTVLLMPAQTLDESQLRPVFAVHDGTQVFAESVGAEAAVKQVSGESVVDFSNGSVEYTARDKSGSLIKNYWVNFDQKNPEAKLFVNGPVFDELQTGEVDDANKREVLLNSVSDAHDVFIANLGNADLTGLSVSLDTEAQKTLALDAYFFVGGSDNDTLPAFTKTERNENQAAAKIRLRLKDAPENLETSEISGIMTISSDAGTKYIYLTGTVLPKIVTDSAPDGVKYVPYSVMIQTNNHDDSNKVAYSLTKGKLPRGVELNETTGEIYGVPKEIGTFDFTVSASFSNQNLPSSEKDFNIVIEENTDQMVYSSCDDTILAWVEDMGYYEDGNHDPMEYTNFVDQVFEMDHEFNEFVKFFLDGEELRLGTDYYAEEGSTKVTILAKTFRNAGNGTHTIAAEFRDPGTNEMYKNAQNYTANVKNSGGGSSSSIKQEKPKEEQPVSGWPFDDVLSGHWFYNDVKWAFDNGYMVGVSSRLFAPNNKISLPMVVTTLARMSGADLQEYAAKRYQEKYSDIPAGMWFSEAAVWAKEMDLLTEEPFKVDPPLGRSDFAIILVKYLKLMGVDIDPTAELAVFEDASLMTAEENRAFQVLHYYGIFNGVGNNYMDPDGDTTRAQLAALLHRLSGLEEKYN